MGCMDPDGNHPGVVHLVCIAYPRPVSLMGLEVFLDKGS